jgi:CRP-like cAMP-binding protein
MATAQISSHIRNNPAAPSNVVRLGRPASQAPARRNGDIFAIAREHASGRRLVAAGSELFAEGEASDNIYIVLDGWLILHRILADGRRQILDFALPGAALGYRAHADVPFSFTAEAVTGAEVAVIPLSRISQLLYRGSDCAMTILEAANDALLGAFDALTDVGRRSAREAVAHFLLRMNRRVQRMAKSDGGGSIRFPLTQEHIGDALGLTAVHVCRTLSALRADGLVEVARGRLRILDKQALADEAGAFLFEFDDARLAS